MPTPVGPAPRDPDDPDLWDWSGGDPDEAEGDEPALRRHPGRAVLAAILVVALVAVFVASAL